MDERDFRQTLGQFAAKAGSEIEMDDHLGAIGVDSIGVLEMLMKVESATGRQMPTLTEDVTTVQDLYDLLCDDAR